jgi:MoaA/NifB/PqqE/SkfB family radical SAM enzyme
MLIASMSKPAGPVEAPSTPSSGPVSIQIDASLHCQLACPLCPTADGRVGPALGAGHLKVTDFEALLRGNPQIAHVELSNYGEMFLNPQLADLLACAFEHNVTVSGSNGVNLNFAREDALEAVVRYRVRALTCSIDGATQETYSRYRVNGNSVAYWRTSIGFVSIGPSNGQLFHCSIGSSSYSGTTSTRSKPRAPWRPSGG